MAELREALTERGFDNVRTYIQSGNVVYDAPPRAATRTATLRKGRRRSRRRSRRCRGFAPVVMVLTAEAVAAALAASPYRDEDPAQGVPGVRRRRIGRARRPRPEWRRTARSGRSADGVIHLHCPNGLGRSKLGGSSPPPSACRRRRATSARSPSSSSSPTRSVPPVELSFFAAPERHARSTVAPSSGSRRPTTAAGRGTPTPATPARRPVCSCGRWSGRCPTSVSPASPSTSPSRSRWPGSASTSR